MTKYFLLFSLFITITSSLSGKNLKLANTFSDGIVFQRDKPINIWGSANPNQSINLRFGNETKIAQSDDTGASGGLCPPSQIPGGLGATPPSQNRKKLKLKQNHAPVGKPA